MDSSFYTRVGERKYEVHFETDEKWKYTLVEAACREAIDNAKPLLVTKNIVLCKECLHYNAGFECLAEGYGIERDPDWFCAGGERKVQE